MGQDKLEKLRAYPIVNFFNKPRATRIIHVVCPFHKEHTASLAIYPDNSFYCFGCQKHGANAVDFLVNMGATFKEACQELEKRV